MPKSIAKTVSTADLDPTSRSDLPSFTGYLMKRAWVLFQADLRDALKTFGLTQRTASVLAVVVANPDISQSDVAASLAIERSGIVVIIDELETRDLIRRERAEGDRRAYALRATLNGQQHYKMVKAAIERHEQKMLSALTAEEQQMLHSFLAKLSHVGETA